MKSRTTRQVLLSFSMDRQLGTEFSRRYERVVDRCSARSRDYPSKSAYVEHLLERGLRRIEVDFLVGGDFRRIMRMMIAPSASDVAKVVLACHLVGSWSGFAGMPAYERFQKLRRATLAAPVRRPRKIFRTRAVAVDIPTARG